MTIDLRDYYPIHDECKKYINSLQRQKRKPQQKTIDQYRSDADRMHKRGETPLTMCTSKSTYYKYRAAWSFSYRALAKQLLDEIKEIKKNGRINEEDKPLIVEYIVKLKEATEKIKQYPPDYRGKNLEKSVNGEYESEWQKVKNNAPKSKSKRNQRLPNNFEDRFFDYVSEKKLKYTNAIAISLLSGCRPEELKEGIVVELQSNGSIMIIIKGAKTHDGKFGQDVRSFCVRADTSAFNHLKRQLEFLNSPMKIMIVSPGSFGTQVTKYGKKCFSRMDKKNTISPYNFRHNFSKKIKQSLSDVDVATVLGHCTDKSQDYYSKKNHSYSGQFEITNIIGSQKVEVTRTTYDEYIKSNQNSTTTYTTL